MIKGAVYKSKGNSGGEWEWDYVKVLELRKDRTIHWTPKGSRDEEGYEHFWSLLPNGDIQSIVNVSYTVIVYFYNLKENPDQPARELIDMDYDHFVEVTNAYYDLARVDGVEEDEG